MSQSIISSGNSAFELVSERGWRRGLGNMLNNELSRWWKTRMWWVQCLIWVGLIGFLIGAILFSTPTPPPKEEVSMLYGIFAGLFPSVGVVIIMQGTVVGEKNDGTAAWVLSKPVTRIAFMLSKVIANSLGVLVTMVLLPGVVAYLMYTFVATSSWNLPGFLAGMSVVFLNDFFFLSLTLMLGTFFASRGPVIGIALALLFLQQNVIGFLPALRYVLPWQLIIPVGNQMDAVVPNLMVGGHNYPSSLILVIALESLLFVLIGLWRFGREEF
jgi:ABC-2 type transport system permease protein